MDSAVAAAGRFRHVVFPDGVRRYGRAVDAAPVTVEPYRAGGSSGHDARPVLPPSADAESFLRCVFAHAGVGMRHYKPETLHRRLPACLRALRAASFAHARSVLQRQPQLAWDALGALLIGVTSFFRDPPVFDALRHAVLPGLLAGRAARRPLRVWSAGCSDGAELYSVAMLLAEIGGFNGAGCELLGTDCRPAALARAAAGSFDAAAVAGVPASSLSRWFTFNGADYQIDHSIRSTVEWRPADALRPDQVPPGPWDLVLCRNLAIYLQPAAASALWASISGSLRDGGVLVTGKAERPTGVRGLSPVAPCLYRKEPA